MNQIYSWNRIPNLNIESSIKVNDITSEVFKKNIAPYTIYGNGRSYGDVCLNNVGTIIQARGLNKFIDFNDKEGIFTAEAGVTLEEILSVIVPKGWFLTVTPGTKFVT
ncbi:FAD-binding protein, partial [Pedobacter nototheniae]